MNFTRLFVRCISEDIMIKFGQIKEKNENTGTVTIRFSRPEACGNCHACGYGSGKSELTLPSNHNVGEWVRVEFPENRFLQATTLVYIIPLIGLLAGLFLGWLLFAGSDLYTVVFALLGLVISFGALYIIDKRISRKPEWSPKITDTYPDKPASDDLGCDAS